MLHFCIVSGNTADRSRSRQAGRYAQSCLEAHGAQVDFIDLRDSDHLIQNDRCDPLRSDPLTDCTPEHRTACLKRAELVWRWKQADGWIVTWVAEEWHVLSPLSRFLTQVLDPSARRYRPFLVIAGTDSGHRSLGFEAESLASRLIRDVSSIPAGATIVVSGEAVCTEQEPLPDEVTRRIERGTRLLVHLTQAMRDFSPDEHAARER